MSGRKRGLAVDVLGLIIGVVVLAASAHDNAAGTALLDQAAERCGMPTRRVPTMPTARYHLDRPHSATSSPQAKQRG
ncbi:hypothetical protein AS594_33975 [Streptomyces agglomeratus]|uniref:Transposase n=1 Tax=Streptomyces agglomeratus TaxID=285458 RepID=A0A1E5PH76_9ACTN|nr:hypothetical protein AS594_33975 [Streptomyces agglomeratus]